MTAGEYSALLKHPGFWTAIDAENILIFQTDSVLCARSPFVIEDFEHLGYIGCAHDHRAGRDNPHWDCINAFWGVGGLSFRHKSLMLECIQTMPPHEPGYPEDVFFSNCIDNRLEHRPRDGLQLCEFCTQLTFFRPSFGVHNPKWMALNSAMLEALLQYCPEARAIIPEGEELASWMHYLEAIAHSAQNDSVI